MPLSYTGAKNLFAAGMIHIKNDEVVRNASAVPKKIKERVSR